jgi:hypothetical protein
MNDARALAVMRELPPPVLPESYKSAKLALEHCVRIDECRNWADKAAALASYAKQANDDTLRKLAMRIQGRAVRREGELLEEIEPGKPGPKNSVGVPPPNSGRFAAAKEAGLSKDQTVTALRVANVPAAEFEAAIESDNPPTVTELAKRGTATKPRPLVDLGKRSPQEFEAATGLAGAIDALLRYSAKADLRLAIKGFDERERAETRRAAHTASHWLLTVVEMLDAVIHA